MDQYKRPGRNHVVGFHDRLGICGGDGTEADNTSKFESLSNIKLEERFKLSYTVYRMIKI